MARQRIPPCRTVRACPGVGLVPVFTPRAPVLCVVPAEEQLLEAMGRIIPGLASRKERLRQMAAAQAAAAAAAPEPTTPVAAAAASTKKSGKGKKGKKK